MTHVEGVWQGFEGRGAGDALTARLADVVAGALQPYMGSIAALARQMQQGGRAPQVLHAILGREPCTAGRELEVSLSTCHVLRWHCAHCTCSESVLTSCTSAAGWSRPACRPRRQTQGNGQRALRPRHLRG